VLDLRQEPPQAFKRLRWEVGAFVRARHAPGPGMQQRQQVEGGGEAVADPQGLARARGGGCQQGR
jgi:hypothetical protein